MLLHLGLHPEMVIETLAVALILAAVLMLPTRGIQPRTRRWSARALVLTLCGSFAWVASALRSPVLTEAETPFRPIAVPAEGFVSSDTCAGCHPDQYDTWFDSYHRKMTQLANPEAVLGPFEGTTLNFGVDTFVLGYEDETFFFDRRRRTDDGEVVTRHPVLMTTGSHTVQAYWYPTGDRRNIALFPFVYLVQDQRWVPRRSVFILPPEKTTENLAAPEGWPHDQRWNHTCIHCHTTHGRPNFGELDTKVSEFGIACESCHGPAEEHLAANQTPWDRYSRYLSDGSDESANIVNPVKLDQRRASQVCGICHAITYPVGNEVYNDLEEGRRYRAGNDLEDSRRIVRPTLGEASLEGLPEADPGVREQSFWNDGVVRVKGREYNGLLDTPCYQRGEMGCFSCHEMHQKSTDTRSREEWANDQLKPGMRHNLACVQCHTEYESPTALMAHTRHDASSSGSNCYNCHMPFTTFGLLKAIRTHQVTSPSVELGVKTGRPDACNNCHLDKTLAWTAEHLDDWYGIETRELDPVRQSVPASLLWVLAGDAAQRSLITWHMGLDEAREASGYHWMTPVLAQLLVDPYDGVRFNAVKALKKHPALAGLEVDYLADEAERQKLAEQILQFWQSMPVPDDRIAAPSALIDDPEGVLPHDIYALLLAQRNDRPVALAE